MFVLRILFTLFLIVYCGFSVLYLLAWSKGDVDRKTVLPAFLMIPVFGSILLIIFIWSSV